jgi:hypothetical protein
MIHQLIYLSSSEDPVDPPGISDILATARERNPAHNITGVLCFSDGMFFQVLEGEHSEVKNLFDAIKRDTRHTGVILLVERDVPNRAFKEWSMAWYRCPPDHPLGQQVNHLRASTDLISEDMDEVLSKLLNTVLHSLRS